MNLFSVESFHPVVRTGEGVPRVEIVTEILQRKAAHLDGADGAPFDFFGGTTLVLNSDGSARYVIHKSVDEPARLDEQRQHLTSQLSALAGAEYQKSSLPATLNFGLIHRGF